MGKTVIESLLVELGLDTEKLKESAAIDKIEKIRASVKGLNDDLGDVEKRLKGIGMSVGGFGKAATGGGSKGGGGLGGVAGKANSMADYAASQFIKMEDQKRKIGRITDPAKLTSIIEGLGDQIANVKGRMSLGIDKGKGSVELQTLNSILDYTKEHYETVKDNTKEEKKARKSPSTIKGMMTGMGGGIGTAAAGVYLLKSITDGLKSFFDSAKNYLAGAQAMKQAGEAIGLSAEQMQYFETISKTFGDNTGSILKDMDALGKSYVSTIPNKMHYGLSALGINPLKPGTNEARPLEDILPELADAAKTKFKKKDPQTYMYFREWFEGMDKFAVDMLQEGAAGMATRYQSMVKAGMTKPQEQLLRESKTAIDMASAGDKLATKSSKFFEPIISIFMREFGDLMGTEGRGDMELLKNDPNAISKMRKAGYGNVQLERLRGLYPDVPGIHNVKSDFIDRLISNMFHPASSMLQNPLGIPGMGAVGQAVKGLMVDKMTLNLSIDQNGNAKGNVNGSPIGSIYTNVSPNKAVQ